MRSLHVCWCWKNISVQSPKSTDTECLHCPSEPTPIIIVAYSPSLNPDHLSKLSWLELKMHLKDLRVKICQSVLKLEGLESRLFVCSALPTWTPPSYMRPSPPPLPAALSGCNNDCSHVALKFLLSQCCFRKEIVFSPQLPVTMAKMCAGKV